MDCDAPAEPEAPTEPDAPAEPEAPAEPDAPAEPEALTGRTASESTTPARDDDLDDDVPWFFDAEAERPALVDIAAPAPEDVAARAERNRQAALERLAAKRARRRDELVLDRLLDENDSVATLNYPPDPPPRRRAPKLRRRASPPPPPRRRFAPETPVDRLVDELLLERP